MKTLTVDNYQRVRLPDVKPRQVFAHEKGPDGQIILTSVVLAGRKPNKVRFEKRGGRTVGVIEGAQFDEAALKQALAEFP
jgi:hypothetical protein